jgi:hypothetical protein
MGNAKSIEYFSLIYVPNVTSSRGVSIAAVFFDPSDLETGFCAVRLASDWEKKVRSIDPRADIQMLRSSLIEIRDRLLSRDLRGEMISELENSFSNAIEVTPRSACRASFLRENIELFVRQILNDASETVCRDPTHSPAPIETAG